MKYSPKKARCARVRAACGLRALYYGSQIDPTHKSHKIGPAAGTPWGLFPAQHPIKKTGYTNPIPIAVLKMTGPNEVLLCSQEAAE